MIMVQLMNIGCVLVLLLCSAWLSTARLHHPGMKHAGGEVNAISGLKASASTTTTTTTTTTGTDNTKMTGIAAVDGNLKKILSSRKLLVRRQCGSVKSAQSNAECKKSKSKLLSDDEVDGGFVAFSADYHAPRHHPPKNN